MATQPNLYKAPNLSVLQLPLSREGKTDVSFDTASRRLHKMIHHYCVPGETMHKLAASCPPSEVGRQNGNRMDPQYHDSVN